MGDIGLRLRVRNPDDGSNGGDIGNPRWSCVVVMVTGIVWTVTRAPEMLLAAVKAMMPWAIPAIGIPMGVVIWPIGIGLGAQRG